MLLDEVEAFARVVEAGSFTAAARAAGVPKSNLSRAIARLEAELGVELLRRSTRVVRPTEAGQRFYERVSEHVGGLREAMSALHDEEVEVRGLVRITAPVDIGQTLLADTAAAFLTRHPKAQLEVELSSRVVNLLEEGFDCALRATARLKDSSLIARRLGQTTLKLYASPAYLEKNGAPTQLSDLDAHQTITFRAGGSGGILAEVTSGSRLFAGDFGFVRASLRAGAGIGPQPTFYAQEDVALGHLVNVIPDWSEVPASLYFVYPATRHLPRKVAALRDLLVARLSTQLG